MKYLRGTADIRLVLATDNINLIKCWVDEVYTLHSNIKNHTESGWQPLKMARPMEPTYEKR